MTPSKPTLHTYCAVSPRDDERIQWSTERTPERSQSIFSTHNPMLTPPRRRNASNLLALVSGRPGITTLTSRVNLHMREYAHSPISAAYSYLCPYVHACTCTDAHLYTRTRTHSHTHTLLEETMSFRARQMFRFHHLIAESLFLSM